MASWRKIGFCWCAGVAAVVCCPVPPLYASPRDDGSRTVVAPNQSASVLEADASQDATPGDESLQEPAAESESHSGPPDQGDKSKSTSSYGSTLIRRRGAPGPPSDELIRKGFAVPWYRSGLVSLAIVLSLMLGVYWLTRRFVPSFRAADHGMIRVVARSALSPKHNVALMRVGRRLVLVGLSGERMTTLSEITDAEEVAELVAATASGAAPSARGFDRLMAHEAEAFGAGFSESLEDVEIGEAEPPARSRRVAFQSSALSQLKDRLRGWQTKK